MPRRPSDGRVGRKRHRRRLYLVTNDGEQQIYGRTVFVSSKAATFSLDTASRGAAWWRHGDWKLPFAGRAHFDPRLDAWVGLSGNSPDTLGYLCSCDIVPTDPGTNTESPPAWKLSKEKLFCEDPAEQHVGASLVYVGVARFCLVQYFSVVEDDAAGSSGSDEPRLEASIDGVLSHV